MAHRCVQYFGGGNRPHGGNCSHENECANRDSGGPSDQVSGSKSTPDSTVVLDTSECVDPVTGCSLYQWFEGNVDFARLVGEQLSPRIGVYDIVTQSQLAAVAELDFHGEWHQSDYGEEFISEVKLDAIPETIGHFTNLKRLVLTDSMLTSLPASIWNLTELEELELGNNRLTTLPDSIGNLTKLKSLQLRDNGLEHIPETIGNLINLEGLDIGIIEDGGAIGNRLTSVPDSIGNLTELVWLNLTCNELTSVPDSMKNLTKLETLILSYNKLSCLPPGVPPASVTNLYISENPGYNSDTDSIPTCKSRKGR